LKLKKTGAALLGAGALALGVTLAPASAHGTAPYLWKNCTHVHTKYRHGVGKLRAHDHTRSGTNPVTNFYRSTRLYNTAVRYNSDLDRDRDGVACEQH
jgi:Spy/CpxP family protein refolding chaperone